MDFDTDDGDRRRELDSNTDECLHTDVQLPLNSKQQIHFSSISKLYWSGVGLSSSDDGEGTTRTVTAGWLGLLRPSTESRNSSWQVRYYVPVDIMCIHY